MARLFFILLLFPLQSAFVPANTEVAEPRLWELTPQEFFAQPMVQREFDLQQPDDYLLSIAIYQATNQLRKKKHLSTLKPSRALHLAGAKHIEEMRHHDFFAHENPYSRSEHTPYQRIKNRDANFRMIAENLALLPAFTTPNERYKYRKERGRYVFYELNGREMRPHTYESFAKEVVTEWYRSRGHRENLLNKNLTHIGVAVHIEWFNYQSAQIPKVYAVQEFGAY